MFGEKQKKTTLGLNIYKKYKVERNRKPQLEAGDPTHSVIPSDNQLVRDSQPSEVIYFSISDGFWIITISLPRGSIGNYSKSCLGLSTCLLTIINMQGAQGRSQGKNTEMKPLLSPPLHAVLLLAANVKTGPGFQVHVDITQDLGCRCQDSV